MGAAAFPDAACSTHMPYSSFAQFGAALCETAGVAAPQISPDAHGMSAFHLVLRDVVVNLVHLHAPGMDGDDAFILVTFGAIPQDKELEVLRLIAEANFAMLGVDVPVMGLNPATDEIVMRQRVSLSTVAANEAFATIMRLAEVARQWRIDPTLAPMQEPGSGLAPHLFA